MNSVEVQDSEIAHDLKVRHLEEIAQAHAGIGAAEAAQKWTTKSAEASVAFIFVYEQITATLVFPGGPRVIFNGKGFGTGLGALKGSGNATFNVDPRTLGTQPTISWQCIGGGVVGGGFTINWFSKSRFIGNGLFSALGVGLNVAAGGPGSFDVF